MSAFCFLRPQGDSNPRRRRERAVSLASRRWGQKLVSRPRLELGTPALKGRCSAY